MQTAQFTNTYTKNKPAEEEMRVNFKKTIVLGGNKEPGNTTFNFEIAPYGDENADISGLKVTGNTITINGKGEYTGIITITGDPMIIADVGGLRIAEKMMALLTGNMMSQHI